MPSFKEFHAKQSIENTFGAWMSLSSIAAVIIFISLLFGLILYQGLDYFGYKKLMAFDYANVCENQPSVKNSYLGVFHDADSIKTELHPHKETIAKFSDLEKIDRTLYRVGNSKEGFADFIWICNDFVSEVQHPKNAVSIDRFEHGPLYGYLLKLHQTGQNDQELTSEQDFATLDAVLAKQADYKDQKHQIQIDKIGKLNRQLEELRRDELKLNYEQAITPEILEGIEAKRSAINDLFVEYSEELTAITKLQAEDQLSVQLSNGDIAKIPVSNVLRYYFPNDMGFFAAIGLFFSKVADFIFSEPREGNTEGGVFPAIIGTVAMVFVMTILVTPFGVLTALYLHEYAKDNFYTRFIRACVNNLSGIPGIVFGIFGLGFFIYGLGDWIDSAFYPHLQPTPVFGSPGLIWCSLTLALLTLPVVIVATEEGLSRISSDLRNGSIALGATQFETIRRIIIPMSIPGIMTGVILAIARASGEVAPLMLVGVVKLAATLPISFTEFPFVFLDQKIMHLGFHIFDVGFRSPNIEASKPLVYASSLLLLLIVIVLNTTAVYIRNKYRKKFNI